MNFAEELIKVIKENQLTNKQIRHTFGISQPTLDRWKLGEGEPASKALKISVIERLKLLKGESYG